MAHCSLATTATITVVLPPVTDNPAATWGGTVDAVCWAALDMRVYCVICTPIARCEIQMSWQTTRPPCEQQHTCPVNYAVGEQLLASSVHCLCCDASRAYVATSCYERAAGCSSCAHPACTRRDNCGGIVVYLGCISFKCSWPCQPPLTILLFTSWVTVIGFEQSLDSWVPLKTCAHASCL